MPYVSRIYSTFSPHSASNELENFCHSHPISSHLPLPSKQMLKIRVYTAFVPFMVFWFFNTRDWVFDLTPKRYTFVGIMLNKRWHAVDCD